MSKLDDLKEILRSYGKVAIAYSGGCDSNFLYHIAKDTLGKENVLSVICIGAMMSKEDIINAKEQLANSQFVEVPVDVFSIDAFKHNFKDRCYHCKKTVMSNVISQAKANGFKYVIDGKNLDDEGVYRPGIKACQELGILSPLSEAKMTKQEIRECSKKLGIVTHDKPANACLASRFPYNTTLSLELLEKCDQAEAYLHRLGLMNVRVRIHDNIARIEVEPKYFDQLTNNSDVVNQIKELGFDYVTLDLKGITSGGYDR